MRAALSALFGLLALLTMPVAVLGTRYFDEYELLHASGGIPVVLVFAFAAFALGRSARGYDALRLGRAGGAGAVRAGRILAWIGIWLAGAAAVSLIVWGLLEYQGTR